mmetsp:Transcript_5112/g.3774  ORF Transcript_5112/g.3774 Transcript_5112/m.3774 type:complete len:152 (-) Transcript_5112:522-977(-)
MKIRNFKQLDPSQKKQVKEQLERKILFKIPRSLCRARNFPHATFDLWLHNPTNPYGKELLERVSQSIGEIFNNKNPKSLDYEVLEPLRKQEDALLTFQRLCHHQQFQLFHRLRKMYADRMIERRTREMLSKGEEVKFVVENKKEIVKEVLD